ncbi:hypothetical protein [Paucilactobacillus wasatchensis]|uniref:Integral membrane protein n=1 Tax=Paucilactobacillus wasatchensis TaxID=1335616 RepID=A0A0D1A8R9_9LACO|nr:hypothetical protein [Paucilactobacillus wasatchensis]KIS04220.1 hypothetical protein WDC_0151 [Paucilactobacillus wasatchensis]
MLITILLIIFALIALYIGWYLVAHRNRPFLIFNPATNLSLSHAVTFWGVTMLVVGLVGLVAALINILLVTVIILVVGCFSGTLMLLSLMIFMR